MYFPMRLLAAPSPTKNRMNPHQVNVIVITWPPQQVRTGYTRTYLTAQ